MSISDHDALYIIAKIPTNKYQPHYKFIRDMKNVDLQKYIDDFKQLPFSMVYSFDNPDDQLDTLNKIFEFQTSRYFSCSCRLLLKHFIPSILIF